MDCVSEVRVEQFLDEPTRFAIRFQEDLEEGEPRIMQSPELQCEQIITVAVEIAAALVCLARGPITERKSSLTLGGPGSWYEIDRHRSPHRNEPGMLPSLLGGPRIGCCVPNPQPLRF